MKTSPFVDIESQDDDDPMSTVRDETATAGNTATAEPNGAPAPAAAAGAAQVRVTLTGRHVCPYCGHQRVEGHEPCPHCTMEDTPATRQATKARIGPWYVLQNR